MSTGSLRKRVMGVVGSRCPGEKDVGSSTSRLDDTWQLSLISTGAATMWDMKINLSTVLSGSLFVGAGDTEGAVSFKLF